MKTDGLRKRMRDVDLRQREPLDVEHVGSEPRERGGDAEVLGGLQRQPGARAAEHARGERVEALDCGGSRRAGGSSAKRNRDVASSTSAPGARERRRELVVVPRRVGGRIGDDDAHGRLQ